MSRKPRGLNPEEERLWRRVADSATPLEKPKPKPRTSVKLQTPKFKSAPDKPAPYQPPAFQIGEKARHAPPIHATPAPPLRMDKKSFARMKRGKSKPEARLDLHGMTAAAAHTALTAFLLRSHNEGLRLVLVITGKGRGSEGHGPIPERIGILRQQLPHWVSIPPLNHVVLQVSEAHQRHGGSGAFYIYLTRRR